MLFPEYILPENIVLKELTRLHYLFIYLFIFLLIYILSLAIWMMLKYIDQEIADSIPDSTITFTSSGGLFHGIYGLGRLVLSPVLS